MWSISRTLFGPRPALVPPSGGLVLDCLDEAKPLQAAPGAAVSRSPLRDRYIAARFRGVARSASDLRARDAVIKAARHYFEEERADVAIELLALAEEQLPGEATIVLARLEILYLAGERDEYIAVAARFQAQHPSHDAWPEVQRLGRKIAPHCEAFAAAGESRTEDHYGPWPHLPNWIQASWDLCAEVAAGDFHRAVRAMAAASVAVPALSLAAEATP